MNVSLFWIFCYSLRRQWEKTTSNLAASSVSVTLEADFLGPPLLHHGHLSVAVRGVPLDLHRRVGALTHGTVHFALAAMKEGRRLPFGRRQPLKPWILDLLHIWIGLVFLDPLFSHVFSSNIPAADWDAPLRLSVHCGGKKRDAGADTLFKTDFHLCKVKCEQTAPALWLFGASGLTSHTHTHTHRANHSTQSRLSAVLAPHWWNELPTDIRKSLRLPPENNNTSFSTIS